MKAKLSKLQIRAKVLSVLEKDGIELLQNRSQLDLVVEDLKTSTEVEDLVDILIKEFANSETRQYEILGYLLMEFGSIELLKEPLWDIIKNPKYKDTAKEMASLILRDFGERLDFDELTQYYNNPEEIIDFHTQKLLETAACNPESQVDFLDFLYALPDTDKIVLINSLKGDYDGDYVANVFSPILEANSESDEIQSLIIEILGTTRSVNAVRALDLIYRKSKNEKLVHCAKKSLSLLKLSGVNTHNCQKYLNSNVCKDSKIHKCYATIPDGLDYQGFVVSRIRENGTIQVMTAVVQFQDGIVDSFGFNSIEQSELGKILDKFTNDEKSFQVPAQYCKAILDQAYEKSISNDTPVSYEYVCWKALLADVEDIHLNFEEMNADEPLSDSDYELLYKNNIFDNWFYEEDTQASSLLNSVKKLLSVFNKSDFTASIEKLLDENFDIIFDKNEVDILSNRLIFTSLLYGYQGNAQVKYVLECMAKSLKANKLGIYPFLKTLLKNSVYQYLLMLKEKNENKSKTKNIFNFKKDTSEHDYVKIKPDILNAAIGQLEADWNIYD